MAIMCMWKKENVEPAEEDVEPVEVEPVDEEEIQGEVQEEVGVGVEEEEKEDGGAARVANLYIFTYDFIILYY